MSCCDVVCEVGNEIFTSVWSLFLMSGMTVPMELYFMLGNGKLYHNIRSATNMEDGGEEMLWLSCAGLSCHVMCGIVM